MIEKFKTTEKTVRVVEVENTLVVEVKRKARKEEIKEYFEKQFKVKVESVNTLIKDNKKYAYVRLNKSNPAIDIATKFGVI